MNEFFNTGLGKTLLIMGIVLLAVVSLGQLMNLRYIGAGITPGNTISVSGYGESYSTPDIATFSYSIVSEKTTVADAQKDATAKANAISAYLKAAGIDEKDIQTSNYSINPQYDYVGTVCTNGYCPPGRQTLRGYEVRQTTSIKVRDTDKAGDILAGIGAKGATEVSGLQFTFDNPQQGQLEARGKAIDDAEAKAEELAKELGVSLVRVVSFNESSGGSPVPMYAKMLDSATGGAVAQSAPEISVGQNKVTSNVSVTYEIR
jgi:hypothetical protein